MRSRRLLLLCPLAALLTPAPASSAPLADSRVGGLALVGPAIAHPASVFYNPATLSLLPGHHVFFDGTLRLGAGSAERRRIDPQTGIPAAGFTGAQDMRELFPQLFLTASTDFRSDSVALSLTLHTPYSARFSCLRGPEEGRLFDPAAQGPGRYQMVEMTLYHLFVTPAASFRITDELSFGVSFSYVFGMLDVAFVRDGALAGGAHRDKGEYVALDDCGNGGACGYEAAAAAEAVRVRGTSNGVAFSLGLLGRPHRSVLIGASYSRIGFSGGTQGSGDAWVRRSAATMSNAGKDPDVSSNLQRDLVGRGTINYALPDSVHFGVSWQTTSRLLLAFQFHWLSFSQHGALDIRLTGTQFRDRPSVPDRLVQYRGFQDVFGVQLGAGVQLGKRVQLQAASMVQTSAVPAEAVSLAAIDSTKVDSLVGVTWTVGRNVTLRAGYGLVIMPTVKVDASVYSPVDMVTCVDGHYDVELPECKRAAAGRGLPSAAGQYALMTHRVGLSLSYDIW
jgi:long-subunit fatty acid transport protein